MLDAVLASSGATARCHQKRKWAFHQRHAVFVKRQLLVDRQGQVVKIRNERPRLIHHDLAVLTPGQPLHLREVDRLTFKLWIWRSLPGWVALHDQVRGGLRS